MATVLSAVGISTLLTLSIAVIPSVAIAFESSISPSPAGNLPDGREYEQSTPTDKNGGNIQGRTSLIQASASGDKITSVVQGGLPGGEGAQEYPYFLSTRSAAGWSTQGLLPAASTGPFGIVRGWDEEIEASFDTNRPIAGAPLQGYLRTTAGGELLPVVSGLREPQFTAASSGNAVLAFETSKALVPQAIESASNVYVWSRQAGAVALASVLNNGESASPEGSFAGPYDWFNDERLAGGARSGYYTNAYHALAVAGNAIYFSTAGASPQLYVRLNPIARQSAVDGNGLCTEIGKACTQKVSLSENPVIDPNGEQPAAFVAGSPDGSSAIFLSAGKLTVGSNTGPQDEGLELYRYDVNAAPGAHLTALTPDTQPGDPNGAEVRGVLGMSTTASYVYFVANGVLANGAARGDCAAGIAGAIGAEGTCNLYVWHDGAIRFIAALTTTADPATSDGLNWTPSIHLVPIELETTARVSQDGRTLLFRSLNSLTGYGNQSVPELYRYSFDADKLGCVSCIPSGAAPSGAPTLQSIGSAEQGVTPPAPILTRNLSADGGRVIFESPDALAPQDGNNVTDVYEWELAGTGTCTTAAFNGGCIFPISSGSSLTPSYFADASANGNDVFFFTSQQLVAQDGDELVDIYDARVGGGLASQNPVPVVHCSDVSSCRGVAVGLGPAPAAIGSLTFGRSGAAAGARCKQHKRRRHRSCKQGHKNRRQHQKRRGKGMHRVEQHGRRVRGGSSK